MPARPTHAPEPRSLREPAMDLAVDLGFAVLLLVCGARYFSRHELAGTGTVVLVLALGAGACYALAVVGPRRDEHRAGSARSIENPANAASQTSAGSRRTFGLLAATSCWLPLAVIAPSFGWCAFALFFAVHRVLRGRAALVCSGAIVVAVSAGLLLMSRGQDLGLVLGPFFGGLVLAYAYAALERSRAEQRRLIGELIDTREQLARSEREAGAAAERGRVASELHDTVVQRTASALLLLESDDLRPGGSSPAVAESRDALRDALVETRRLLHGLADPGAAAGSLTDLLRAEAAAAAAGFSVEGTERRVPGPLAHALQRIVQESLLNARKHAAATDVRVVLAYLPGAVRVSIADDGAGFRGDENPGGFGLRAMAWRAQNLGGELTVDSERGRGTTVTAVLPTPPRAADAGEHA